MRRAVIRLKELPPAFSFQASGETGNDALNKIRHLMDHFEQRLCLNNLRLAERYVESELHLWVWFFVKGSGEEFIAHFQRKEPVLRTQEYRDVGKRLAVPGMVAIRRSSDLA